MIESEEEMARKVVAEMQRQDWTVYQEVTGKGISGRADIVGVRGPLVMVVECKTSLSLKLLDQLCAWRGEANYIVGAFGGGRVGNAAHAFCRAEGVGLWAVVCDEIAEKVAPRLHRQRWSHLRNAIRPEHQSDEYAKAGTRGGYWTPFRGTCDELARIVRKHPDGIELREALLRFKHHYANRTSAVSALPGLIRRGVVPGVRIDDGRPLKIYPVAEAERQPA